MTGGGQKGTNRGSAGKEAKQTRPQRRRYASAVFLRRLSHRFSSPRDAAVELARLASAFDALVRLYADGVGAFYDARIAAAWMTLPERERVAAVERLRSERAAAIKEVTARLVAERQWQIAQLRRGATPSRPYGRRPIPAPADRNKLG